MTYINHREAHVSAQLQRIYDFIHHGHVTQEEVDKIIEKANQREVGQPETHPREGGGKRLPSRSARPRKNEP